MCICLGYLRLLINEGFICICQTLIIYFFQNPCDDSRHEKILPLAFNCSKMPLPNVLIVGPQKTGSTALATYLSLHPNCTTNDPVPSSFEELQFFGGANYGRGILW
ncbi:Bifunctional heparan sulfate N-deacetylase/N-sulfotransferase 1 [Toxocara canis]|uniref:Bifunctional heparan sulfate N-deacetylase/N-sulfotransferase 1 n=1 Tax=Toxocara canis TaxID=6265 RepID=A0A0B2USH2_TOXCA|nr:Bifunctional heparan sulfate N-deacetylase/N-sulfotransferase 1 [Toxocara canis]